MRAGDLPLNGKKRKPPYKVGTAYWFGDLKGYCENIRIINDLDMPVNIVPRASSIRRAHIIELFKEKGIFKEFLDFHWPNGKTQRGKKLIEAYFQEKTKFEKK
jgi:hypothetical protein